MGVGGAVSSMGFYAIIHAVDAEAERKSSGIS
ncbi:uncharacterized protein G2W53_027571 [Senna tora]|uniref:Uncharacterized protein n=1 Tax=Senna tora TaxID=362788 RepID=A0A834TJR4_9FABA|nr:uncharacterized protein G2W53_027571 [Senna tora]